MSTVLLVDYPLRYWKPYACSPLAALGSPADA